MEGEENDSTKSEDEEEENGAKKKKRGKEQMTRKFLVQASYLEIYNEDVRDLLSSDARHDGIDPSRLRLKEHPESGVYGECYEMIVLTTIKYFYCQSYIC